MHFIMIFINKFICCLFAMVWNKIGKKLVQNSKNYLWLNFGHCPSSYINPRIKILYHSYISLGFPISPFHLNSTADTVPVTQCVCCLSGCIMPKISATTVTIHHPQHPLNFNLGASWSYNSERFYKNLQNTNL